VRDATVAPVKRLGVALAVGVTMALVPACMEGKRPVLVPAADADQLSTGDAAIDVVLRRLELAETATFEARYQIHTLLGDTVTTAEAAQEGLKQRAVRVGDVLYRDGTERDPVTCSTATGACEPGLDDAQIASLMVTRTFFSTSAVARLGQVGRVASGPATLEDRELGGAAVVCVTIPVSGGSTTFCATPEGVLAPYEGADTRITLLEYRTDLTDGLGQRLLSGAVAES